MNPIETLLEAAEYIARREREAEHGYASTLRFPDDLRSVSKRPKTKKSQGNRTSHNELEKNSFFSGWRRLAVPVLYSNSEKSLPLVSFGRLYL
ncbi:max dimerization protein 1-like [Diabrotica undecimpunctata]|uniref:max dimerization protein 1-like n=1 Tax=Diabrotica undecimpunctata TaxID=50387 RepID=UPI003B63DDFA